MKITRISIYKMALPYMGGTMVGAGNVIDTAMASVVVIETDAGILVAENLPLAEKTTCTPIPKA